MAGISFQDGSAIRSETPLGVSELWGSIPNSLYDEAKASVPARAQVKLRPWPFPYRSALSVNSGSRGFDDKSFTTLYSYLNGDKPTKLGDGLGLEFGIGLEADELDGPPCLRRSTACLAALGEADWIDSVHVRDEGRVEAARFDPLISTPSILVADGAGIKLPDVEGVQYATSDAFGEKMKFGQHMNYVGGRLQNALDAYEWTQWMRPSLDGPNAAGSIVAGNDVHDWAARMLALFNRILLPVTIGNGAIVFKRFYGHCGVAGNALGPQIMTLRLDQLALLQGGVIVAQPDAASADRS